MGLRTSETHKNLMRAFAGESQARNRYTFAAAAARNKNLYVVEAVFKFTAEQEKAHAKAFFDALGSMEGEEINIDAGYPVETYTDIKQILKNAKENEYKEYNEVYKSFGDTAEKEGFASAAYTFREIAEIEKLHSERFAYLLDLMEKDELFVSRTERGFMCLNCGYIFSGTNAPEKCPVCKNDRGYFIRMELVPYGGKF